MNTFDLCQEFANCDPAKDAPIKGKEPHFLKYLDPTWDPSFWKQVEEKWLQNGNGKYSDLNEVLNERRAERIIDDLGNLNEENEYRNPIIVMIDDWYEEYHRNPYSEECIEYKMFEKEVSSIAQTIISLEYSAVKDKPTLCKFSQYNIIDNRTGITKTLLHAIAESNKKLEANHGMKTLTPIARCLLKFDPSLVYATTEGEEWEKLPVEIALLNFDDEMAALFIDVMKVKGRVRLLFEYNYSRMTAAKFKFIDYINRPDMQKTVMAVLDSMISPHMKMPICNELQVSHLTWKQYRYHFRILDGDMEGKCRNICGDGQANWTQMSCLQAICMSNVNKIAIEHPVVRLLARRKWESYGRFHVRLHLALYLSFLMMMSFSLIGHYHANNRYNGLGLFVFSCEMMTLICCFVYLGIETGQCQREKLRYFFDAFNYLDIFGITFLMLTIILHWTNKDQVELASGAFLLNYFRLFKFLSAFRSSGIYVATLSILIKENLPIFFVVYSVLLSAFSGACFIATRRQPRLDLHNVILRGIRRFTEGQVFADDYSDFSTFSVMLILGGSLTTSLLLVNVLIAQLSESYAVAKSNAILHYDVARLKFVTRIENSRFKFMNLRMKHYQESTLSSDEELFAIHNKM